MHDATRQNAGPRLTATTVEARHLADPQRSSIDGRYNPIKALLEGLGLSAALLWSGSAVAADVSEIELRRLFEPTEAELAAEAKGRIYIYDGLRDIDVQRALDEEFERVDKMMFIRTIKTKSSGEPERDADTGVPAYIDDGC